MGRAGSELTAKKQSNEADKVRSKISIHSPNNYEILHSAFFHALHRLQGAAAHLIR